MELIFKGTTGTWSANSADTVFSEDMVMICEVNGENYDKRKANAKLIAAAPELLEALQLLLYGWDNTDTEHDVSGSFDIARSAVNKAL